MTVVLAPAAWQLVMIHPYELSYYNELIGGPRGAWRTGFELSYWYDPFNQSTIAAINERLPHGATVDFFNPKSSPETFVELQSLGQLRGDLRLGVRSPIEFPYVWLLTQHSNATAFTASALCDEALVRELTRGNSTDFASLRSPTRVPCRARGHLSSCLMLLRAGRPNRRPRPVGSVPVLPCSPGSGAAGSRSRND